MPSTYDLYRRVTLLPKGFSTTKPHVTAMRPHFASLTLRKRKAVHNHMGTVHAIAVCNGLEAAMGLLAEATTPAGMRWLPKGMEVRYLAKSTTDLICTAKTTEADWGAAPDVD